jgi:uncharacterized protein (TIGR00255 family)
MTGYGKAQARSKNGVVTIEMRSLNHKFFELSAKLPNGLAQFEDNIKKIIHEKVKRGKIYLNIEIVGQRNNNHKVFVNSNLAKRYINELKRLKKASGLKGEIRIEEIMALPGVVSQEAVKNDAKKALPTVKAALKKAVIELVKDRAKEGRALNKDMGRHADNIKGIVDHITERSTVSVVRYRNHLSKMVKDLTGAKNVDKGRLAQEVALFAKNCDISEELTRLASHLASFKETLRATTEVGKKLDFIAQELHREANTIASKSSDFKISKGVIQMKSDIEKIREQVKNVE